VQAFPHLRCPDLKRMGMVVAPIAAVVSIAIVPGASAHPATARASAPTTMTTVRVGDALVSLPATLRADQRAVVPVVVTRSGPSPLAARAFGATGSVFADDSGGGYGVPAPPASSGHPVIAAIGALVQQAGSATMGVGIGGLIANGLASAGLITLPATVPGALASGAVAAGGAVIFLIGYSINQLAKDPADFDYTVVAKPRKVSLVALTTKNKTLRPVYAAQNALNASIVRSYELAAAFRASVNRADGATIRGKQVWVKRQTTAALTYAHQTATVLRMLPSEQQTLVSAYEKAGFKGTISQHNIAKSFAKLGTAKGQAKLSAQLSKLGLSSLDKIISTGLSKTQVPNYGVRFPQTLADPNLIQSENQAATTVAAYNAASIRQIIAQGS
jgi:hypothetical protein